MCLLLRFQLQLGREHFQLLKDVKTNLCDKTKNDFFDELFNVILYGCLFDVSHVQNFEWFFYWVRNGKRKFITK